MAIKVLITGANGQLGNELRLICNKTPQIEPIYTDVDSLDITDETAMMHFCNGKNIDYIVNCAAYTAVDKAESEQALCYLINSTAVANIARTAKNIGAKLIHISTDYVFDGKHFTPYREDEAICPTSTYGKAKAEGERHISEICPTTAMTIRTAWLYSSFGGNFVKTMMRLGSTKEEIGVVADQIGTPTYAKDLAEAIISIILDNNFRSGTYHYSNEGVCSWYDFAVAIMRANNLPCRVRPIATKDYPTAAVRPPYSVLDKTKIKQTYGIDIPHWHDSLMLFCQMAKME